MTMKQISNTFRNDFIFVGGDEYVTKGGDPGGYKAGDGGDVDQDDTMFQLWFGKGKYNK